MNLLLFGLEAALNAPQCWCVELVGVGDDAPVESFRRGAEDGWRRGDTAEPIASKGLIAMIESGFGSSYRICRCRSNDETLVYSLEGGSVKVSREAGGIAPPDAGGSKVSWKKLAEALGIPKSKRQHKAKQAYHLAKVIVDTLSPAEGDEIRFLDVACGKSYVGFSLSNSLKEIGQRCTVHGIEGNPALVTKCETIAAQLGWAHCTFEHADLRNYKSGDGDCFDALVALHACDSLTDDAIRIGLEAKIPYLFLVPCCQREMRSMFRNHPLDWISRYGLLEEDLADVLTDAFRCLVLEAAGYDVKVLHFVASEHTPKNLLIVASYRGEPNANQLRKAQSFLKQFGVNPSAARLLDLADDQRVVS